MENEEESRQYVQKLRDLMDLYFRDLFPPYRSGKPVDLIRDWPKEPDFQGKIPVFVCWFQGFENAPEMIRICHESQKRYLPEDRTVLCEITAENLNDYVFLPEHILEHWRRGAITNTHLSDILRAALLYRYGGIWLDATYYLTAPLPEAFFDSEFHTVRHTVETLITDVPEGRWLQSVFHANKGNLLMGFLIDAFCYYWFKTDTLVEFFLIDYIIDCAYRNIPPIREMIDSVEPSEPELFTLQWNLPKSFSQEEYDRITKETGLFKLTYKYDFPEKDENGELTWYGYIRSVMREE